MAQSSAVSESTDASPPDHVNLKDPATAALLAWLVPGLGHWYQGRFGKALLFFVCIMGTFSYGLYLGEGRVVYASWRPGDKRLPYLCQVGVGLPAMPALVQAHRFNDLNLQQAAAERRRDGEPLVSDWFMAPPAMPHELNAVHKRLHRFFELGTIFTMVAGLLNVLVIYDAWGGPALAEEDRRKAAPDAAGEPPGNS